MNLLEIEDTPREKQQLHMEAEVDLTQKNHLSKASTHYLPGIYSLITFLYLKSYCIQNKWKIFPN